MDYKKIMDSLFKENFELERQRDQYKAERDKFEQMINEECERGYKMEGKYHDMKAERNSLIDDLSWYKAKVSRLEREKKEREKRAEEAMTLAEEANCQVVSLQELLEINESSTKDLILKLQNSDTQKIEDENKELKRLAESRKGTIKGLKRHVKDLRLQSNTYFDEWQTVKNLYTTLTNHIRMKAENNPGVSRYIDLVNYIDRLEKGEN
ncbi:hypothetical protein QI211_13020 [Staphylococcus saprophyticus]|nr:hypothetical protein [Staphylococcus saprophyticus]